MQDFFKGLVNGSVDIACKLVAAIVILIIGVAFIKLLLSILRKAKWGKRFDPTLHNFIISLIKAILYIILFATLVAIMGVPMASFVTVIASAGAAIALALQGSLSNFAAGIIILIFRPIRNGEYVDVSGSSGTVIDVGIFYTTLRTPDNKHIIIPNSVITSSSTTNYSREDLRRLDLNFQVAYGTDPIKVKELLTSVVKSNNKVRNDPAPFISITELRDSSLNFVVRVWCKSADYWDVNFYLLENCMNVLKENGIVIPFNQIDVHIVDKK